MYYTVISNFSLFYMLLFLATFASAAAAAAAPRQHNTRLQSECKLCIEYARMLHYTYLSMLRYTYLSRPVIKFWSISPTAACATCWTAHAQVPMLALCVWF